MRVVGAVLAGGKSSRMGRDKAGVAIPDDDARVTLGQRAIAVLRAACDHVVVLGHGRGMPSDVARLDDVLDDAGRSVGPLGGLLALLRSGRADAYVVIAVDMPAVNADHVRSLLRSLSRSAEGRGAPRAACFAYLDVIEPLPIAIADADFARDAIERLLASGERSLRALMTVLDPAKLAVTDRAVIRNVNTLADFDEDPSAKLGQ